MNEHPNHHTRFILLASLGLAFVLLACSKEEPPAASPATEPAPAPQPQAAPEPEPQPEPAPEPAAKVAQPTKIENVGLSTPESVLYDAERDLYLVSNINGNPVEADGNGFITRIAPDGSVKDLKWIDGSKEGVTLNAPKGMVITQGVLYVADVTAVRKFDASSGEPKGEIAIKGATFLNDVAAGEDGAIYVSDSGVKPGASGFEATGTDAIYKISGDKAEPVVKGTMLGRPNGLLVDGSDLLVVTFGTGELYKISNGKKTEATKLPKGALDGVIKTAEGKLVISSWDGSQLFTGTLGGEFSSLAGELNAPADIGYDSKRNLVLVPQFNDNAVQIVPAAAPAGASAAATAQGQPVAAQQGAQPAPGEAVEAEEETEALEP